MRGKRTIPNKLVLFLTLLVPSFVLAAPYRDVGYGAPHDASADGYRTDWLINITLIFISVLFAVMVAWMLYACFRHNKKHTASASDGTSKRAKWVPLGIALLVFIVVDGNLFVNSTIDMHDVFWNFDMVEKQPDTLRVQVNAHQWAWDFRYEGPDGEFGTPDDILSFNELRVPIGRPVLLQMAAVDVLHSFYLPHFRVKMDVVPGSVSRAWFRPVEVGEFEIACAQHCGAAHYKMSAMLHVTSEEDYADWAAQASLLATRTYDSKDKDAHWAWQWQEIGQ